MKKKTLSLLLVLVLCLSLLSSPALARETDYFGELPPEFQFSALRFDAGSVDDVTTACTQLRNLLNQNASQTQLLAAFNEMMALYLEAGTQLALITVLYYGNPTAYENEYLKMQASIEKMDQTVLDTVQSLLRDQNYGPTLIAYMGEEEAAAFLDRPVPTVDQLATSRQIAEYVTQYQSEYAKDWSCVYEGRSWTADQAITAFGNGMIDVFDLFEIYNGIYREMNSGIGKIYLEMTQLRNALAISYGYSNYAEYAYAEVFGRDYTLADAAVFREEVKAKLVPLYKTLSACYNIGLIGDAYTYDGATQDELLDTVEPYIGEISSELADAFAYLRKCELIDARDISTKLPTSFTIDLPSYGAAYILTSRSGGNYDLNTVIHEFGHFAPICYGKSSLSYDILETHSQGLEALFLNFADELYGELASEQTGMNLFYLLNSIISGCMYDELQEYAYTTPNLTVEGLNRKSAELIATYTGQPMAESEQDYSWIEIPHTFESPMYYISYASSAMAALELYIESETSGFTAAADRYLSLLAASGEAEGFQSLLGQVGLGNPFASGTVSSFSAQLDRCLNQNVYHMSFEDIADSWAKTPITLSYLLGILDGTSETTFSPNNTLTRAMAVTVLYRMEGEPWSTVAAEEVFDDVPAATWYTEAVGWAIEAGITDGTSDTTFSPNAYVNAQEFAVMLYRWVYGYGFDYTEEPAPVDSADWAGDALIWCDDFDILESDRLLAPTDRLTRAELAAALINFLMLVV